MCLSMLLEKVSTKTNFPNTLQVQLVLELYYVRRVVCVFGADIVLANIVSPHIHPGQPTPLVVDADMDWGISSLATPSMRNRLAVM